MSPDRRREGSDTDAFESGPSEPVAGIERAPAELSQSDLMTLPPLDPARKAVFRERFPVPIEEWERLTRAAEQAEPNAAAAMETMSITEDVAGAADLADEAAMTDIDPPEDDHVLPGSAAPGTTISFEGIPQTAFRPPDNTIAVGPNDVLVAVNTDIAGYTKSGSLRFRWAESAALFGSVLPSGASVFDPKVAYDHYQQRWIIVLAARRASPAGSWLMVAVSQGTDPAGAYWVWALDATRDGSTATNNWADYPMLGFDTRAIYIMSNMFQFNGGFQYSKLRILNKAELYAGGSGSNHFVRWYDFWNLRNPDNSMAFTIQPAIHFRGTTGTPPAYLVNALFPSGNTLTLWTLTNPIAFWAGGTPGLSRRAVNCQSYDLPPQAIQPGTATRIATNDNRLLNAVYQNAGGVQRLWTTHTVRHTWPGEAEARSAIQWYEIDIPSSSVAQQGRYGATGRYYFFPAIQTDISRNAYLVFGRSASDEFGQLRQTGRRVNDGVGTLQGSALVKAGEALYTGGRWGDYFGICRDGGNSTIVWMYGEYADTDNAWGTRVCAARFG
jgi:hypothetical protein